MKAVKGKIRVALWLKPETMEKVRTASAQNACGSLSEFIVAESDHRHASMLFKLSVEMAMLMNIVAAFVRSARRSRSSSTFRRETSGGMRHSITKSIIPMCI